MTKLSLKTIIAAQIITISSGYAFDFETSPEAQKIRQMQSLSITTSASISSNLYKSSSSEHTLGGDFSLDPSLSLDSGYTLLGHVSLYKDLRGERKEYLNDAYFGATKSVFRKNAYSISVLGLAFVPLSEASKDDQYLQAGFMLGPTLNINMGEYGIDGLRISIRPSYRHNVHRYTTSRSGGSNSRYSASLSFTLTYAATDKLTLISRNNYSKSFTYRKNTRDAYRFEQAITYLFTQRFSMTVGHLNGGNPLAANGVDTEIYFLNRKTAQVYTSVSYTF